MKLLRILALAVAAALLTASTAMAEKLVIAGRDGGYASALSKMVAAYKAANALSRSRSPGARLRRPADEKVTISMREKAGAYDVIMLDDTWAVEFMSRGWLADLDKLGGGVDKRTSSDRRWRSRAIPSGADRSTPSPSSATSSSSPIART